MRYYETLKILKMYSCCYMSPKIQCPDSFILPVKKKKKKSYMSEIKYKIMLESLALYYFTIYHMTSFRIRNTDFWGFQKHFHEQSL